MLLVPLQYFHHYPPKDLPVLPGSVPQSPALSSPPASALWSVPDPVPVFLPVLAPASLAELLFLLAPASLPELVDKVAALIKKEKPGTDAPADKE